jgi:Ca-activated chloride channel family protein
MTNKITLLTIFLIFSSVISLWAQSERKYIRSGNHIYSEALDDSLQVDSVLMQKAEIEYRKAIDRKAGTFEGRNNLGNSLYRQKKYEDALKEWESLTSLNVDEKKKGQLYHNIGNAYLMNNKLKESIEAYKNALRNYPNDTATKYNLAFAQSKLQQQQQQQQNQDQNQQNDQNQDQQQQQQQQQQQEQQNQQQQQQNQQQQEQQAQEQQAQQQQGKEEQGQPQEMKEGEKISKKDAERILRALQMDEKQLQQKLKKLKNKNQNRKKKDKDW